MREELEQEIDVVRRELLGRLAELEPLPAALRHAEQQLQEAQDREREQERRSMELSTTLSELRMKVTTVSLHPNRYANHWLIQDLHYAN